MSKACVVCIVGLSLALCASSAPAALLHYWDFEDASTGSTGLLADTVLSYASKAPGAVANPLNTNAAAQTAVAGMTAGTGIKFNGYGLYNSALTDLGGTFTFETWFRQDAGGSNGNMRLLTGWGGCLGIHLNSANLLGITVGNVSQAPVSTYVNPGYNKWIYMAVVADASNHLVTVYANTGSGLNLVGTGSVVYSGSSAGGPFRLGNGDKYTGSASFDHIAIWDQALTPAQLAANMADITPALNAPEPATMAVLGLGGLGVLLRRRRR